MRVRARVVCVHHRGGLFQWRLGKRVCGDGEMCRRRERCEISRRLLGFGCRDGMRRRRWGEYYTETGTRIFVTIRGGVGHGRVYRVWSCATTELLKTDGCGRGRAGRRRGTKQSRGGKASASAFACRLGAYYLGLVDGNYKWTRVCMFDMGYTRETIAVVDVDTSPGVRAQRTGRRGDGNRALNGWSCGWPVR